MAAADPALPFASEGEIEAAYLRSKELFATGETKPIAWRLKQLQKLRAMIVKHEATIESAIVADMHRAECCVGPCPSRAGPAAVRRARLGEVVAPCSPSGFLMWACVRLPSCTHRSFEAQIFETRPCIAQIDDTISFITSGSLSRGVSVPLALGTASARVEMVPKGAVLIIGAWNYPAALTLGPLVDVLGAGNTAVIKPSELSPRSASVIGRLLEETFTDGEVLVLHGAVKETTQILKLRWDHIVYT
ncbi:ALDH3A2, partial [Symbiodinium sp. KB8]